MLNTLRLFIEQHISDSNLKIEDMAETVNMGRTVFYEKIRELVGVSPSDFLRQVRMERARQLVAKSRMSIAEVAYAVGFTDPKYFSKCFKKETGMTPSEYRDATLGSAVSDSGL
jgi:AraC-like DNA-binding protein